MTKWLTCSITIKTYFTNPVLFLLTYFVHNVNQTVMFLLQTVYDWWEVHQVAAIIPMVSRSDVLGVLNTSAKGFP